MTSGATYTPIATTTLGSAVASYTFSSIPSTYTDLFVVVNGAATSGSTSNITLQYNGDTTSGLYSATRVLGDGTSASSARSSGANYAQIGDTSTDRFVCTVNIMNYLSTSVYKTALSRSNSQSYLSAYVSLWRNTNAITSITIGMSGQSLAAGTTLSLYGIASA